MYLLMLYNDHILPFSIATFDSFIQEILGAGRPNPLQTRVTFSPSLATMLFLATVTDAETTKAKDNAYSLQLSCVTAQRNIIHVGRYEWQQLVTRRENCKIQKLCFNEKYKKYQISLLYLK